MRTPRLLAVTLRLAWAGCLFEPSQEGPGYPSEHAMSISTDSAGLPVACAAKGGLAVGAAGGSVFLVDCAGEELLSTVDLGAPVIDVALGEEWALALLADSLVPVSLATGQASGGTGLPAGGVGVSAEAGKVVVLCVDGTIVALQEGSWDDPGITGSELAGCTAMAANPDATALYVADPAGSRVARIDVMTGRMTAEAEVGGEIMDLERAGDGFCIAVQGSNEIWAFGPMCSLLYLLTFPEVPDCGAAMPDNSFFLAGCGEVGLVVCALSGEQVYTDGSLQGIQDVALSGDYALLASAADSSFVLLGR